jgi:hypothetical protein
MRSSAATCRSMRVRRVHIWTLCHPALSGLWGSCLCHGEGGVDVRPNRSRLHLSVCSPAVQVSIALCRLPTAHSSEPGPTPWKFPWLSVLLCLRPSQLGRITSRDLRTGPSAVGRLTVCSPVSTAPGSNPICEQAAHFWLLISGPSHVLGGATRRWPGLPAASPPLSPRP